MNSKLLLLHPSLAPYRVDFFNFINSTFDSKFYFYYNNVLDQNFDQQYLTSQISFRQYFLNNGFRIFNRTIRFGVFPVISDYRPNIIICSEFGQVTLLAYIYYWISNKKFKLYTICDDSLANAVERKGLRLFVRNFLLKRIDGVIFASQEVCEWHRLNFVSNMKMLNFPIIHEDQAFRSKIRSSLDVANTYLTKYNLFGKKIILFTGRLVEVKNIFFLVKAFSKSNNDNSVLIIVGDGPLKQDLVTLVDDLKLVDKVLFMGRLEGKPLYAWYSIAHLFILPSTFERFGAVVNEALLGGCSVLCSNKAGAITLLNGLNGADFDPYNEIELISLINMFIINDFYDLHSTIQLRPSLMPFTFKEKIIKLLKDL
ncbi:glycosyltransferase [Algoriphagus namhaensis]|uniref:Glycosyltransferase n=1 Tax=Algoriphagus namhaensis TaxID=915353 RepID=A0ABV8AVY2_9BACT